MRREDEQRPHAAAGRRAPGAELDYKVALAFWSIGIATPGRLAARDIGRKPREPEIEKPDKT